MCADFYRFSESFDPLFLEGMTARIFGAGLEQEGRNVRCVGVGAMPEYINDFGALVAGVWDTDQQDNNLEMNTWELAQFRMRVVDDMRVRLRNSPPVQQWRSMRAAWWLPQFPQNEADGFLKKWYWRASEFFVWQENDPMFELFSNVASATARIIFSGWRFKLEPIKEKGKIDIWLSDWPSRTPN